MAENGIKRENSDDQGFGSGSAEVNLKTTVCQPCLEEGERNEVDAWCLDCKEHLCRMCVKIHRRTLSLKQHDIVEKSGDENRLAPGRKRRPVTFEVCQLHKDQFYKFYCPQHDVFCCGDCTVMDHRTCKMQYIPDAARDCKDGKLYADRRSTIHRLNENINGALEQINTKHAQVEQKSEETCEDVISFNKRLVTDLDSKEEKLINMVNGMKNADKKSLNQIEEQCRAVQQEVATVDNLLNPVENDDIRLFMASCRSKMRLQGIESDFEKVREELGQLRLHNYEFKTNKAVENLLGSAESLGTVGKVIDENTNYEADLTKSKFLVEADVEIYPSTAKRLGSFTGMTEVAERRLVVVDSLFLLCILVCTESKRVIKGLKLDQQPWDVAHIGNKQVAITMPTAKKVLLVSADRDVLKVTGSIATDANCYGIGYLDGKMAITMLNDGTCQNESTVHVGSLQSGYKLDLVRDRNCEKIFRKPLYVVLKQEGGGMAVYVSDLSGNSHWKHSLVTKARATKAYDWANVLMKYGGWEFAGSEAPMDVVDGGQIFISNKDKNSVHVIKSDMKESSTVLKGKDGIMCPQAVLFCAKESKLYVCCGGTKIKVFKVTNP